MVKSINYIILLWKKRMKITSMLSNNFLMINGSCKKIQVPKSIQTCGFFWEQKRSHFTVAVKKMFITTRNLTFVLIVFYKILLKYTWIWNTIICFFFFVCWVYLGSMSVLCPTLCTKAYGIRLFRSQNYLFRAKICTRAFPQTPS